jgi:glutathione S-transferase
MDYFFSPLACSFAGHLMIREHALPVRTIPVSLRRKLTAEGQDFHAVSPKAHVPVLRFDDGRVLTENSAILQVLADLAPASGLLPPRDTPAGQATLEWLGFVCTEVHKLCLYPIFQREAPEAVKAWCRTLLSRRLSIADDHLAQRTWLAGDGFTLADAHFGWALMLSQHAGFRLADAPDLQAYWQRLMARPAFAACVEEEQALFREWA